MRCCPSRLILMAVLLATGTAVASPRDELLRFVSEDTGFCLLVQNLRVHLKEVIASPFAERWVKSSVGEAWLASKEWQQLQKTERYLLRHLGVGWTGLREDLLGEAFVFAYRAGPPDRPDQEQGLFLLRARDEKVLAEVIGKLNALQKQTGELQALEECDHKGTKYFRRKEGRQTNYYLLRGPILVFSGQESALRQAIDQERKIPAEVEPPFSRRLRELGLDRTLASLVINPRALDAAVLARADTDSAAKTFATFWKTLDGAGLGLYLDRDIRVTLAARARPGDLSPLARRLLVSKAQASKLWAFFPDDALLATSGRIELSAIYAFLAESMPKPARQAFEAELKRTVSVVLGKDFLDEVLPALGPDWGVCVTAPPAGSKDWTPSALVALEIGRGQDVEPIDEVVLSALQHWARLAVVAYNRTHPERPLSVRSENMGGSRIRYLSGDGVFPAGVQPAIGLRSGYLILASSPAAVARFKPGKSVEGESVPLLRISVRGWRNYLGQRREELTTALAGKDGSREEAAKKLDALLSSLGLFDRVELRQRSAPGLVALTLTLEPSASMKR